MREGINKFDSSALKGPSGTSFIQRVEDLWNIVFGNLVKKDISILSNLEKIEEKVFAPKTSGANANKSGVGTIFIPMEERIVALENALTLTKAKNHQPIAVMLEALEKQLRITAKGSFEERINELNQIIGYDLQGNIAERVCTLYKAMFSD